jgi:hypothetical protein
MAERSEDIISTGFGEAPCAEPLTVAFVGHDDEGVAA